ncbi:MAG: ATP synthase subunit I [Thermodesulfovibrionales bacterium]|nr:ATP synthase subunit I [Thermodesulfovibrionales bacterium]
MIQQIMIKRIYKQSTIFISLLALGSYFFTEWRFAVSIIIGSIIFLASLWSIAWGVKKFLYQGSGQISMIALSGAKMIIIFALLVFLAKLEIINVVGFLTGFTVSLMITAKEGFTAARKNL